MENKFLKARIENVFDNSYLILKDNYSFVYLNAERQKEIKELELGQGTFTSAISLFALLNLISKMYSILKNGYRKVTTQTDIDEYFELRDIIKENNKSDWKRIKKYFKKPRFGDINETDAFTELVIDMPIDLGFNMQKKDEIQKMWSLFRNKLTHLISLKGDNLNGQMLIQTIIFGSSYLENIKFLKSRYPKYPAFDIVDEKTKRIFEHRSDIDNKTKQYILKDSCYVDQLKICCEMIIDWLKSEIKLDKYPDDHLQALNDWLDSELNN